MTTKEVLEWIRRAQIDQICGDPEWQEDKGWLVGVREIELHNGIVLLLSEPVGVRFPEGVD